MLVVDLTTRLETAYYDMSKVLDTTRISRPSGTALGEDPTVKNWLHKTRATLMRRISG